MTIPIERTSQMPQLKRAVIKMVWEDTINIPNDDVWRKYTRNFTYEKVEYVVSMSFRKSAQYFTYRNLTIEYPQEERIIKQSARLH